MNSISRRKFLTGFLASLVAVFTYSLLRLKMENKRLAPEEKLRELFSNKKNIPMLGIALSNIENYKGIDKKSVTLLFNELKITPSTPIQKLQTLIATKIEDDYKLDKTIELDGWILSRTEAQIYRFVSN